VKHCKITGVAAAAGVGAFFFDDQVAIRRGAPRDGFAILGDPITPGYDAVRQPATAVSVMLQLSDGYVAHGDCVAVQYSGVGGRDPVPNGKELVSLLERDVAENVRGLPTQSFRELSDHLDALRTLSGFGTAAAYGLSQAMLDAVAHTRQASMAHTIQAEWGVEGGLRRVPVYAQSGEARQLNVDKMILRGVDSLPHGLINSPSLIGPDGALLLDYVSWVSQRVQALRRDPSYRPVLHFDVYGLLGLMTKMQLEPMVKFLLRMEAAAEPFLLRVEQPLDAGSRAAQIEQMAEVRSRLRDAGSSVQLVADEWANTFAEIHEFNEAGAADMIQIKTPDLGGLHHSVEAVLDCQRHGVLAHIGGSCSETDRSARVCTHLAMATHADQILAKPGMGVDEGLSIVTNEMARTLRLDSA
jgi:methylaspartate ammonia-lyase